VSCTARWAGNCDKEIKSVGNWQDWASVSGGELGWVNFRDRRLDIGWVGIIWIVRGTYNIDYFFQFEIYRLIYVDYSFKDNIFGHGTERKLEDFNELIDNTKHDRVTGRQLVVFNQIERGGTEYNYFP
jgi:hypothetical protein